MIHKYSKSVIAAAAAIAVGWGGHAAAAEEPILYVYNWSDYIAEDTIANFEAETGIKVTYDVFDSNEVLESKLLAGRTGYDVVVPSGAFLERQIKAGVFQKLDKSKLPNLKNMDPVVMEKVAVHDPGNEYAIDYMWGTTGLGFNIGMIAEAFGEDYVPTSWDLLFDPAKVSKLKDCGVHVLDAPSEILEIALAYLGLDPHTDSKADYAKAEKLMMSIRPYITKFHSSEYISALANGDICLAVGWSGDVFMAGDRAAEAENGVEIDYVIPSEGTINWFDLMAIPADAPHPDNAHKFLNYIMEPKVVADITNYVWYANGNKASEEFVDPEILEWPAVYPDDEVKSRLFADVMAPAKVDRMRTRLWNKIKTGM